MNILVIGQSNATNMFSSVNPVALPPEVRAFHGNWRTTIGYGAAALGTLLATTMGEPVNVINAGRGSTSLTDTGEPQFWLKEGAGTLYSRVMDIIATSGVGSIDAVVWVQGEADAKAGVTTAEYRAGLGTLFERLRGDLGDVPIFLQELIIPQEGKFAILQAQRQYANSDPLTTLYTSAETFEVEKIVHFNEAGYNILGDAAARAILADLGIAPAPIIQGMAGAELLQGGGAADRIQGGDGNDTIHGASGHDVIVGGRGNDVLHGSYGNDLVSGGTNHDRILGGDGDDRLFGEIGNDTLNGGGGADTLKGGAGYDLFVVDANDVILDFKTGIDRALLGGVIYTEWP